MSLSDAHSFGLFIKMSGVYRMGGALWSPLAGICAFALWALGPLHFACLKQWSLPFLLPFRLLLDTTPPESPL